MAAFSNRIATIVDDEHTFTGLYTGSVSSSTEAEALVGLAVELDTDAENSFKLATDGAQIIGKITAANYYIQSGTCQITISTSFIDTFSYDTDDDAPAVGDQLVGAGDGLVRTADAVTVDPTSDDTITLDTPGSARFNTVIAVDTDAGTVAAIFNF